MFFILIIKKNKIYIYNNNDFKDMYYITSIQYGTIRMDMQLNSKNWQSNYYDSHSRGIFYK